MVDLPSPIGLSPGPPFGLNGLILWDLVFRRIYLYSLDWAGSPHAVYLLALYNSKRLLSQCVIPDAPRPEVRLFDSFPEKIAHRGKFLGETRVVGWRNDISVSFRVEILRHGLRNGRPMFKSDRYACGD